MKKAAIFDLDGTLSDSIMSMKYSGDKTMAEFGYGPFSVQDYKYFVGDGAANLVKRALIKSGDTGLTHFEAAYARYKEIFQANCMYQVKPYEGICALLEELKRLSVRIAVLSNKPDRDSLRVVEALFGKGYFDFVQGQREDIPRKPDPAGVYRIMEAFVLPAGDFLYVGDSGVDMKTGRAAGIFTVGVLWGFRDREELVENGADAVISKPLELLSHLA